MATTLDRLRAALAGKYEIDREIGAGGMATVFLGHDIKHDRDVAIKVLHPDLGAALGSERFLSEIKTTAKLQHPHILPLLDSGDADSLLYYVMPFVVGESLRQRIERERQLPINEAVRIAREVAGALDYAHRQGVIHRDIKPENILIHDKQALVADFGIALAVTAAGGGRLTQTGLSLGTPQYMSPEQAIGERTIDARSDIYSLAAVTYEMITGDPPFAGNSVQAIVAKIMTEKPTAMSRLRETVPESLEDAVTVGLAKLPADRFATAEEFSNALSGNTGAFGRVTTAHRSGPGRRRIDIVAQRAFIPLAVLAIIASAAALWGWLRPQPPRQVLRNVITFDSSESLVGAWNRTALSPDGSTFVFTGGPQSRLFVRKRDELTATPLPGTEGAIAPFFSPDGTQVGFTTVAFILKIVSLKGGSPVTITDSLVSRAGSFWAPDGMIYLPSRSNETIVKIAPTPGAVPTPVTKLDSTTGETAQRMPQLLPNGKGLIFTVYYGGGARTGTAIAVEDLTAHRHKILTPGVFARYSPSGHLLYVTDAGSLMVAPFDQDELSITGQPIEIADGIRSSAIGSSDVAVSRNGTLAYIAGPGNGAAELVWVDREGKASVVDSSWHADFHYPQVSPDGTRAAVDIFAKTTDIWIKQLDKGPTLKLTVDGSSSFYPSWTPDGKFVTYYSNAGRSAGENLWMKRADGSAQAVLLRQEKRSLAESLWSHDGKWLVYRTSINNSGRGDIYAYRPGVDSVPMAIAATPASEQGPTLSPDDRYLAYSSNESGHDQIYVVPFPNSSSAKWAVSINGGTEPVWSHSGHEIFYRDANSNLVSVSVNTTPTFSLGQTRILFRATPYYSSGARREYDVAPDDKRFLMVRNLVSDKPDQFIFVDNWFEELKGKFKK